MNLINIFLESEFTAQKTVSIIADDAFGAEINPDYCAKREIRKQITLITDVEIAKKLAIKYDGRFDIVDVEDVLCNLMGEDAYIEFAEENNLT